MKVRDLLAELQKLDPNLEVFCYEDGPVPIDGKNPGPFDLVSVSDAQVRTSRDTRTNKVHFKFEGDVPSARKVAIIGITPDF